MDKLTRFAQAAQNINLETVKANAAEFQTKFQNLRPPQEFFDFKRFSKPASFGEVQQRVTYNLGYFQANYLIIVITLSVYSLLTNLLLVFVIAFGVAGVYLINRLKGEDLVLPFLTLNTQQLYTGLLVVTIPLGFLASPLSTLLWLIGASSVSVLSHASFMEKPIETVFEEEV
ncbi:hypothetical protein PACTADRAFT_51960 [Pachysolen tannophilus NRRL Y-2460]|uniref:PRA1 family protein n=1 Tax=Pachysolen tannophilus NRRL Y-2460 TaxID=669874 RepID=A0A1E4TNQ0_PACTA|nr:hypothetical protein PACTADRAFT_51960 [Pachysolen tannophilus NRRL Y-2460]